MKKEKAVIISGYFNPLHKGHLDLFKKGKEIGDRLWVIVNSDFQRELKGSLEFMSDSERLEIVKAVKYVDYALISLDRDKTQCYTLQQLHEMFSDKYDLVFANGGDQNNDTIPEKEVCDRLGIELIDGLGDKIQSSSWLLGSKDKNNIRPWGRYDVLDESPTHKVKRITVNPHSKLSLQSHTQRSEVWTVIEGIGVATLAEREYNMTVGDVLRIPVEARHCFENKRDQKVVFIEVQYGDYLGEDDIIRYEDIYGRV